DGYKLRDAGGLGLVAGFLRLRHDAVVGGDDDDGLVGHWGAAGTHLGERSMTGRIEERARSAAVIDAPGADDLRDTACFGRGHVALADAVQERRLAVIDVTHDGHYRRPRLQQLRRVRLLQVRQHLLFRIERPLDLQLAPRFDGDDLGHLGRDDRVMIDGVGAVALELEHHFHGGHADRRGKSADGDRHFDGDFALARQRDRLLLHALADALARGGAIVFVDDDAAALDLDGGLAVFALTGTFIARLLPLVAAGDALEPFAPGLFVFVFDLARPLFLGR